jgi:hypothetical protein
MEKHLPDAPLARDPEGNRILLPETAAGWRIRRHTGGRPRLLLDSAKQPMVFPLHYTAADAEDILPPGNYRLDVIDKDGSPLDVTVPLAIHAHRNADPGEPEPADDAAAAVVPTTLPGPSSDVRLVLEANVRATQMAFLHNQRTLETSLRMAETLRDSVHVLATSQAEWIKSLASQRGLFRNAPAHVLLPAAAPAPAREDEEEDDDDEYDDEPQPKGWPDVLAPIAAQIAPMVAPLVAQMMNPHASARKTLPAASAPDHGTQANAVSAEDAELASKGWELRDLVDLTYVAKKAKARHTVREAVSTPPAEAPSTRALYERVASDPNLVQRFMAIKAQLTPAESALVLELGNQLSDEDREAWFARMKSLSVDEAVRWLRATVGGAAAAGDCDPGASS